CPVLCETHAHFSAPANQVHPPPYTEIEGASPIADRLPLLPGNAEIQKGNLMGGIAAQDGTNQAIQNSQPAVFRGYEAELVPALEYGIGHDAAHGLAKHGLGRAIRRDDVFFGKTLQEPNQVGSQKWNPAFDRGSYGIAILISQQARQGLAQA